MAGFPAYDNDEGQDFFLLLHTVYFWGMYRTRFGNTKRFVCGLASIMDITRRRR
jgi:hypothetical protein